MKVNKLKDGFAIVLYSDYQKNKGKSNAIRFLDDEDDARYNASSMSRVDGVSYAVFSAEKQKLVY